MSATPTDEGELHKLVRHQNKIMRSAQENGKFDEFEFRLLQLSAYGVAWGVEQLSGFIRDLPIADQSCAYEAVCQILRGSELIGSIAIGSASLERQSKLRQQAKATLGKGHLVAAKKVIAAKHEKLPVADALPIINRDLKNKHLSPITRATLYRYRRHISKE